jgi:hypothetical protein
MLKLLKKVSLGAAAQTGLRFVCGQTAKCQEMLRLARVTPRERLAKRE